MEPAEIEAKLKEFTEMKFDYWMHFKITNDWEASPEWDAENIWEYYHPNTSLSNGAKFVKDNIGDFVIDLIWNLQEKVITKAKANSRMQDWSFIRNNEGNTKITCEDQVGKIVLPKVYSWSMPIPKLYMGGFYPFSNRFDIFLASEAGIIVQREEDQPEGDESSKS
jgi:hypothetical protein